MGCIFSQTVLSFTPLLSEDQEQGISRNNQNQPKTNFSKKLRKTSVKFKKMDCKSAIYLPCGCQDKPKKKTPTIEDAVRMRDTALLLKIMFTSEDVMGWAALDFKNRQCIKNSPVELSCMLGYPEIVEIFLENGCSPNLPTKTGRLIHSVLESMKSEHFTMMDGNNLLKNLLVRGCDVNIKDTRGSTALLYCSELGSYQTMKLILPYVAESQFTMRCGGSLYTPLHMSVMKGDFDIVKLLLTYFPKHQINIQDSYGNTPLMLTLKSMVHTSSAKYPCSDCDGNSTTDQQLAFRHLSISIIETLLNSGADPNISKLGQVTTCISASNIHTMYTPLSIALQLTMCEMESQKQISSILLGKISNSSQITVFFSDLSTFLNVDTSGGSTSDSNDNLTTVGADEATEDDNEIVSPCAGVVRLLIQSGADLSWISKDQLCQLYPQIGPLVREIFTFWNKSHSEKPPRLLHITKQVIRAHLATAKKLHLTDNLPLPKRVKDYVSLNTL